MSPGKTAHDVMDRLEILVNPARKRTHDVMDRLEIIANPWKKENNLFVGVRNDLNPVHDVMHSFFGGHTSV